MRKLFTNVRSKEDRAEIAECYDCGSTVFEVEDHVGFKKLVCADCGRVYAEEDLVDELLQGADGFVSRRN